MKCWICKTAKRNLIRLWIDNDFHNICHECRATRVERDTKPYGNTRSVNLTNPAE